MGARNWHPSGTGKRPGRPLKPKNKKNKNK
jgi:hypothetical protein